MFGRRGTFRASAVLADLLLAVAATGVLAASADDRLAHAVNEPQNWLTHGGTYLEQRFSALQQINEGSVARLGLAWYQDFDTARGQESTPLVVDGTLYVTTSWSHVLAFDASSGRRLWSYDPKVSGRAAYNSCCDVVNRGAAYWNGRIYSAALDGRLFALDAKTGRLLWTAWTVDRHQTYTITGAPRVVRGKVLIGNGGADFGVRGYVSAYDALSGHLVWRFYTVPGNPRRGSDGAASDAALKKVAAPTWHGEYWASGGGGTVWDSIVYDAELNQVYIGVGNGSPWNHVNRSQGRGDNLFLVSIVALEPDTGRYLWHYQVNPGESWDFTATQQITLADLNLGGKQYKGLMQAPKNGFFYVLDRRNGKLLSATNYVKVTWASSIDAVTGRPIENPDARYLHGPFFNLPGSSGGHNWHPMAFSPVTGLVYIPAQNYGSLYAADPDYHGATDRINTGLDLTKSLLPADPAARDAARAMLKTRLIAWDPVRQREAWSLENPGPGNAGVLATAGNLVFQGTRDGEFRAYSADRGLKLWGFSAHQGIMAGPITYSVNGTQYVAVAAGSGGSSNAIPAFDGSRAQGNGRMLVFKLGGQATLPPAPPPLPPIVRPSASWNPSAIDTGAKLFMLHCARCHGVATLSSGVIPDLKRSVALLDRRGWQTIVLDGLLTSAGMIGFARWLSPQDVEDIRAYVSQQAQSASH